MAHITTVVSALVLTMLPVALVQLYRLFRTVWTGRMKDIPAFALFVVYVVGYVALALAFPARLAGADPIVQTAVAVPVLTVAFAGVLFVSPRFRRSLNR